MNRIDYQGYVFSENKRIIIKWFVPLICVVFGLFFLWCLKLVVISSENRGMNVLFCAFFLLLNLLLVYGRNKAMTLISLRYFCKNNGIQNIGKRSNACVDIQLPLFISQVCIEGNTRLPWPECFFIISNNPIAYAANHEGNGMRVIQSVTKDKAVLLPVNDNTKTVVERLTNNIPVPSYPRIAYFQK